MRDRYLDTGVFIRSMANRGTSGGLARATRRVVRVLDALGFDVVLVETAGVGQQEIDVSRVVDTVCLLTIPGAGDDIQAIKAGIMEIADVLVVNNRITKIIFGIFYRTGLTGKFSDNLTSGVTTPFTGGTDAGNNN